MAAPGPSLSRPEPTAEDLDRFASEIKASWELDDAPFAAGPAPSPADLAALNPAARDAGPRVEPAAVRFEAPKPAAAVPAPAAVAAPARQPPPAPPPPPAARAAAGPSGTVVIPRTELNSARPPAAPVRSPSYGTSLASSPELLTTGSFAVPKKRTGLYVGVVLVLGVVGVGGFLALKGSGGDETKTAPPPVKTVETPRDNPIPPPPPVEEVEAKKAAAAAPAKSAAKEPEPVPVPAKVEPAPKPEPKVAAKPAPEPRPAPRPVAAARPEPRPAPPPAAPAAKPAGKPAGGGIVRDVPF